MTEQDEIICPALRGIKITAGRCHMKQLENVKFWGTAAKAIAFSGCPCEKGGNMQAHEGKRPYYKTIGTCPLCNRSDKRLYTYHGQDVCGGCKANKGRAVSFPNVDLPGTKPLPEKSREKPHVETHLKFRKDDEKEAAILSFIQTEAKRCRRTVNQQTMWILESILVGANHQV